MMQIPILEMFWNEEGQDIVRKRHKGFSCYALP